MTHVRTHTPTPTHILDSLHFGVEILADHMAVMCAEDSIYTVDFCTHIIWITTTALSTHLDPADEQDGYLFNDADVEVEKSLGTNTPINRTTNQPKPTVCE